MKRLIHHSIFLLLIAMTSLALHSQEVQWQYVGTYPTGDPFTTRLFSGPNNRLYLSSGQRSTDMGGSWSSYTPSPHDMAYAPDGSLLFATSTGIQQSTDDGDTWDPFSTDLQGISVNNILQPSPTTWIARSGAQFYRSENAGSNWELTGTFIFSTVIGVGALNTSGETLVCGVDLPAPFGKQVNDSTGVYRSQDRGVTWELTSFSPDLITGGEFMVLRSFTVGHDGTMLVGIQRLEGKGIVYRSSDGGESWSTTTLQDVVTSIIQGPDGTWFATGANSGVHRSVDDGRTWSGISSGLTEFRLFPIALNPDGTLLVGDVFGNLARTLEPVIAPSSVPENKQLSITTSATPNPVSEVTNLSLTMKGSGILRVSAIDILGRNVSTFIDGHYPSGNHTFSLEFNAVRSGLYYIRIESLGERMSIPVTVLR